MLAPSTTALTEYRHGETPNCRIVVDPSPLRSRSVSTTNRAKHSVLTLRALPIWSSFVDVSLVVHRRRRPRPARLLQSLVVVRRHRRKFGDLIAAQPRGAPPHARSKTDLGGRQRFAAAAQESRQLRAVPGPGGHAPILPSPARRPAPVARQARIDCPWLVIGHFRRVDSDRLLKSRKGLGKSCVY
jgi:hypothetical protein